MAGLMAEMEERALRLGVPLSVHLDLTWRCNQQCIHCYLDHLEDPEMETSEICNLLEQLAGAGALLLILSGGEPLLRSDFFQIVEHARHLLFSVALKTNATLVGEREAVHLAGLGVRQIKVSVYSHRPEVHDGITGVSGSLERTLQALRLLKSKGLNVAITHIVMVRNLGDQSGVKALAEDLRVPFEVDATITPKMNGQRSTLLLNVAPDALGEILPPVTNEDHDPDSISCGAGHTSCYISPYGNVYPCVQFPLACGNIRREKFGEIWKNSKQLAELRAVRLRDLPTCFSCALATYCTRCPGLAYMEGDMRGPSSLDCEKTFAKERQNHRIS
jgi:radical SAM protein with 4Fe4S-binding SPASM domain